MSQKAVTRYEALDSLRGVAACGVVLFHIHSTGLITNLPLVRQGWLFVDFFFVLSGFVIAASYGEKLRNGFPLRAYLVLRMGRIYPLHLAMILAFALIDLALLVFDAQGPTGRAPFTGNRSIPFLFANLGLVQIFVPGAETSWNGQSWSIAAEMWTYALTAIGLVLLKARFRFVLIAIVLLAPLAMNILGDDYLTSNGWSLIRCLFSFALGMLTFDLRQRLRFEQARGAATMTELALLAVATAAIAWMPHGPFYFACPFLFAAVIFVLAREGGAASDFLKNPPFRALGAWSYSIYMVHWLVLWLYVNLLNVGSRRWLGESLVVPGVPGGPPETITGSGIVPDLLVLAGVALVILAAAITYRLIEVPFRDASRGWAKRLAKRPVEAAERVAPTI